HRAPHDHERVAPIHGGRNPLPRVTANGLHLDAPPVEDLGDQSRRLGLGMEQNGHPRHGWDSSSYTHGMNMGRLKLAPGGHGMGIVLTRAPRILLLAVAIAWGTAGARCDAATGAGQAHAAAPADTATFAGGCFWCMEPPFE